MKIESGIPIPEKRQTGYTVTAKVMRIGDSVFFETKQETANMRTALWRFGKGCRVAKVNGGYRIWCVEKS